MPVAAIGSALLLGSILDAAGDVAEPAKRALLVLFLLLSMGFLVADGAKRLQLQTHTIGRLAVHRHSLIAPANWSSEVLHSR